MLKFASRLQSSRGSGLLLCLIGSGILLAAIARDPLTRIAGPAVSPEQVFGSLLGAGILALGLALMSRIGTTVEARVRWLAAAYFAACATTAAIFWPIDTASWVLLGYVAAVCVLLPGQVGALTLASVAAMHFMLTWISHVKVSLTGLPLTVLDLKIALANPAGLWDALDLPQWTRYVAISIVLLVLLAWVAAGLAAIASVTARREWRSRGGAILARSLAASAVVALLLWHVQTLFGVAAKDTSAWQLEGVVRMADTMGVLPFIAYSEHLESQSTGDIYQATGATPPSAEEIRESIARYVDIPTRTDPTPRLQPNILVLLAESTFDPGKVFRLQGKWDDYLFKPQRLTAADGLLRVNAMGGGTWITEFETIVGMDSRMFGYAGMYTHASLSPFVQRSMATYVRSHGYHTWAFFPHTGEFYNARRAYERYGFETILDSVDMGRGAWMNSDREVAASVQEALGPEPVAPFFGYALFIENHAPHDCLTTDGKTFTVRFADTKDFTPECALHEYLRRLGSTTAAVKSLVRHLKQIEARTGRPYVLLVFGDHQPHTFSGTGGFHYDYEPLRAIHDTRTTFFHILSSGRDVTLHCCDVAAPATLLPTLLSAYVAGSSDDVYLGINAWLYERCGSDAIRRDFQEFMTRMGVRAVDMRTQACQDAYARSLAWYRSADVIGLGAGGTAVH